MKNDAHGKLGDYGKHIKPSVHTNHIGREMILRNTYNMSIVPSSGNKAWHKLKNIQ